MNRRHFQRMIVGSFVMFGVVLMGCSTVSNVSESNMSERETAIHAAKQEAKRRFGWTRVRVENAKFAEGQWSVMIWKLPEAPGGFVVFEVSNAGKILDWKPGSS